MCTSGYEVKGVALGASCGMHDEGERCVQRFGCEA
jgi:hypothetical protein